MYTSQQALLRHLKAGIKDNYCYVNENSIKEYAGELTKEKIIQLTQILPAIMIFPQPSLPAGNKPILNHDIIVVTKSDSFDKSANSNNNMELCEKVYKYLEANAVMKTADGVEAYTIEYDKTEIKIVAIDNKFAVVIIGVELVKL